MRYMRMEDLVEESGISRWTLMKELQTGRLHGAQNKKRGTWRVEEACFRTWMLGENCSHQMRSVA